MARFVIADVTDAKVVLQELELVIKNHPSVPVQPIILAGTDESVVLNDFKKYRTWLPMLPYSDGDAIVRMLHEKAVLPAERMVKELRGS
jgi:1-acyl-sn-glycerol-3-phosphate acyltransferase